MKNGLTFGVVAFVCATLVFYGCKESDPVITSDSDGNPLMNVAFPSYDKGKIVCNQVANTSGATIYDEYLTFTSTGGGGYELWSYVKLNDATDKGIDCWTKLDKNPFAEEGEDATLPTEFTYDATTGTISIIVAESTVSTILFDTDSASYMAAEKAVAKTEGDSLFREWETSEGICTFKSGGEYTFKDVSGSYENSKGVILTDGGVPFCWTRNSDENALYYQAYASSRTIETKLPTATARAAKATVNGGATEFNAGRLMFARAQQ